jgi:hypothetical protein
VSKVFPERLEGGSLSLSRCSLSLSKGSRLDKLDERALDERALDERA